MIVKSCIVVDDEPIARDILEKYISQVPYLDLKATFKDGVEALEFLRSDKVDLIILDIKMPRLGGMDLLRTLKSVPAVIITSAYSKYALEGFELSVTDYLLKPFSFQRFLQATEKCRDNTAESPVDKENGKDDYVFIKSDKKLIRLSFPEILYVEALGNYLYVHTSQGKYEIREPLFEFEKRLPADQFIRIHKSFIIAFKAIRYVEGNRVFVSEKTTVPIGRVYRETLLQRLF